MLSLMRNSIILHRRSIVCIIKDRSRPLTNHTQPKSKEEDTEAFGDPDRFGTLSRRGSRALNVSRVEKYYPDDKDNYDKEEFDLEPRKNYFYYRQEITKYARLGRTGIDGALDLYKEMKQKSRLQPTLDVFSVLIFGCSRAGLTRQAFTLYEELRSHNFKTTSSIITSLLNSCAESNDREYAEKRLIWLMDHLKFELQTPLNKTHYRVAIKAFSKLGNFKGAVDMFQEMLKVGEVPDSLTFNMFFIGCANHERAGLTYFLRLYKRMKYFGIRPDHVTFNALLSTIRRSKLGSVDLFKKAIRELPELTSFDQKLKYREWLRNVSKFYRNAQSNSEFEYLPLMKEFGASIAEAFECDEADSSMGEAIVKLPEYRDKNHDLIPSSKYELSVSPSVRDISTPNLLSDDHLELTTRIDSIDYEKLKSYHERFELFGGIYGFIEMMKKEDAVPNIHTFIQMNYCVKPIPANFLEIFRLTKDFGLKRDLLFYDSLLRNLCGNYRVKDRLNSAMFYVEQLQIDGLRPNISTFEALASACTNWNKAKRLIDDLEKSSFAISGVLMMRLFEVARLEMDFSYLIRLIALSKRVNYIPPVHLIESLESARLDMHDKLLLDEMGVLTHKPAWFINEENCKNFYAFSKKFSDWLKAVDFDREESLSERIDDKYKSDSKSKKHGYIKFLEVFKELENQKQDAIKNHREFGNLAAKAGLRSKNNQK